MFKRENNNKKIGNYLKKLIEEKYPSHRQFCKAYLIEDNTEPNDEELRNLSNRLSQILKGNKAIQTYDLPIFTELLNVSCEEILSCGKCFVPISGHLTNYEVSFSKDPNLWKAYAEREDKLILNPDEYNKTVIDYAVQFKNYAFIKFLIDNGYIWFVDDSKNDCSGRTLGFSAGTNIKRRDRGDIDTALPIELEYHCEERGIRQSVIALAMENKDFEVLDSLKAREIPALYHLCIYGNNSDVNCHDYYNDDVIEEIATSNEKVLQYFSEDFQITDKQNNTFKFIYPFLNEVIERLVKYNNKYAEAVIRKAIEHNKNIYNKLSDLINDSAMYVKNNYPDWRDLSEEAIKKEVMLFFDFSEENGFITYMFSKGKKSHVKFCANVIRTNGKSDNFLIKTLLEELNSSFNAIQNIEPTVNISDEVK